MHVKTSKGLHLQYIAFSLLNSLVYLSCRLLGLGQANMEKQDEVPMELDPLVESDDERPESFDDKERKKEMRKGIDLATTLERIEKNFVITDPRLPDNPIVRYKLHLSFPISSILC